jgi:hypothetical protein
MTSLALLGYVDAFYDSSYLPHARKTTTMTSTLTLQIRSVAVADFDAWLTLWRGYQAFYKTDISMDTTLRTWVRMLDPSEPVFAAVAIKDGRVVATVHWIMHRSCWTAGDYCCLQDLFAEPGLDASSSSMSMPRRPKLSARGSGG